MNNNIQIVLQILPEEERNANHDLIKITDNYVVLSNTPKTLIFQFDQVLNANIDKEHYRDYFYHYIPNSTLHELLQGNDTSIIIYNENITLKSEDSFDMRIIEAFSDLFHSNLEQLDIFISFFEFEQTSNNIIQRDLISTLNNQTHDYQIQTIEQLKRYYMLGLSQHKQGQLSVFSIIIRSGRRESRINIIDITNDSTDILNQISDYLYFSPKSIIEKSPLLQILDQSQFLYFISSLHLNRSLAQIQQKLSFTSNIYQKLKKKSSLNMQKSTNQEDDIHYLKQVISRLSNEVYSLRQSKVSIGRSESTASSSYHGSVFSAGSTHSTQLTSLTEIDNELFEKNEQLEHAYLDMRETNMELWAINEKQSELIVRLEAESNQLQQEMSGLLANVRAMSAEKDHLVSECNQLKEMVEKPFMKQFAIRKQRQIACLKRQLALFEAPRSNSEILITQQYEYLCRELKSAKKELCQLVTDNDIVDEFPLPPAVDQHLKTQLALAERKVQAQERLIMQLEEKLTSKRKFFCF